MPQKFQILRCFSCETFNVDIVKKTNLKWQCKMCGENQSIKNVYGTSDTAKECREIAQQLNQRRGEKMDEIQPFDENQYQEDVLPNGRLISKCPYEKSVSSKIPSKLFLDFCPEILCSFLGASWKLFWAS